MRTCERLVQNNNFNPQLPVTLLSSSYHELLDHKKPILGEFHFFTSSFTSLLENCIFSLVNFHAMC